VITVVVVVAAVAVAVLVIIIITVSVVPHRDEHVCVTWVVQSVYWTALNPVVYFVAIALCCLISVILECALSFVKYKMEQYNDTS
jgi:CDP-diglyceride synthetase